MSDEDLIQRLLAEAGPTKSHLAKLLREAAERIRELENDIELRRDTQHYYPE